MWPFRADLQQFDRPTSQELADRLYAHVDMLAGVIGVRHLEKRGTMEATAAYIEQQFRQVGFLVEHECYQVGSFATHNLVAEIKGCRNPVPGNDGILP